MKQSPSLKKIDILAIAFGALFIGIFFSSALNVFAALSGFIGPTQNPPNGHGAISSDANNNVSIGTSAPFPANKFLVVGSTVGSGSYATEILENDQTPLLLLRDDGAVSIETSTVSAGNTTIGGNLTVGGTISASGLGGSSITAGNVTAGVFGSNGLGGSYAFPLAGSLGINTSTANSLPQSLSVYGGGYFSGSVGIGTTSPSQLLTVGNNNQFTVSSAGALVSQSAIIGATTVGPIVVSWAGAAGSPDPTGTYHYVGQYGGHNEYQRGTDNWYIWYWGTYQWELSTSPGTTTGNNWINYASPNSPPIAGGWAPAGTASGTLNTTAGIASQLTVDGSGDITTGGLLSVNGTGNSYILGNVGIGTTNPSSTLDVNGDITDRNVTSSPFLATSATGKLQAGTVLGTANGGTATTTALGTNAFTNTSYLPIATAATSTWVLTSNGSSWVAAAPSGGGLSNGSISATSPITWSGSNVIACPTCATGTIPTAANPSTSIGTSIVNGSSTTFMRSDGAPTINQAATFSFSALGNTTSTGNIQASTYTGTSATLSGAANVNSLNVTTTAVMHASTTILGNLSIGTTTLTSGANVFASFGTGTSTVQIGSTSTARVGCLELVGDGGSTVYYLTISSGGALQISSSACQ
jgi:hypothetical protein